MREDRLDVESGSPAPLLQPPVRHDPDAAANPPVADHIDDVTFRRASSSDLDRLHTLEVYGHGSTQRAYVDDGHDVLFVACQGERIVATRRCSREIRDPLAARVVELREKQIWGADIFCLPESASGV